MGLLPGQQPPKPAAGPKPPSPEIAALRLQLEGEIQRRVELEVRRNQLDIDSKLQQAIQQARMEARQEVENLRREVQSLQQTVWMLQSRIRD